MLILLKKVSKQQSGNMLDLDSTSVCEECAMMCTELQYEHADEDLVVYRDQGTNKEEYDMKTLHMVIL